MLYAHVPWPIFCSLIWLIFIDVWYYCSIVSSQISKQPQKTDITRPRSICIRLSSANLSRCLLAASELCKTLWRLWAVMTTLEFQRIQSKWYPTKALLTWANMTSAESWKNDSKWTKCVRWVLKRWTKKQMKRVKKYLKDLKSQGTASDLREAVKVAVRKERRPRTASSPVTCMRSAFLLPSAAMCYVVLPHVTAKAPAAPVVSRAT